MMRKVLIALVIAGLFLSSFVLMADASTYFVGSKESDVYHYPWCRYVDIIKSENLVYFDTPEDAIAADYRPCKVCKPSISSIIISTPSQTPSSVGIIVSPSVWKGSLNTTKFGESGITIRVIDGDTIEVEDVGRIRLADINTPEMDSKEGREAKEYVKGLCYHKKVYLDIDDLYVTGKYGRIIAVVYVPYDETHYVNLNQLLLKEGYAEARDNPNEFDPADWMGPREYVAIEPSPVRSPLPIPGFELLLAMSGGVVAAICLSRRKV